MTSALDEALEWFNSRRASAGSSGTVDRSGSKESGLELLRIVSTGSGELLSRRPQRL
jgi:hypothetical protein